MTPRPSRTLLIARLFCAVCLAYAGRSALRGYRDRGPAFAVDFEVFYTAGRCFRLHESPFNAEAFTRRYRAVNTSLEPHRRAAYIFLPTQAAVLTPLSYLPYPAARTAFNLLQFGALIAILGVSGATLRAAGVGGWERPWSWAGLGAICLISSVPATLFTGQPDLLCLAGVLGAPYFAVRGRTAAAACAVVLASFKTPIAALPVVFLLLRGGAAAVALGGGLCLAIVAGCLASIPTGGLVDDLKRGVGLYAGTVINGPPNVTGLHGIVADKVAPVHTFVWVGAGLLATAAAALWPPFGRWPGEAAATGLAPAPATDPDPGPDERFRRMVVTDLWFFPLLLTGVFVQLKTYDMLIYAPLVAALVATGSRRALWYAPGLLLACRSDRIDPLLRACGLEWSTLTQPQLATLGAVWVLAVHLAFKSRALRAPAAGPATAALRTAPGRSP